MNHTIIYLILLLLIIVLMIDIIVFECRKKPVKIRILTRLTVFILLLRYLSLILIFVIQQVQKIYIFRFLIPLNIVAIPCILLLSYYIFLRKDGLKVNFIFVSFIILTFIYGLIMNIVPVSFHLNEVYGYLMKYHLNGWVEIVYILILSVILVLCIAGYGLKSSINIGIVGTMVAVMITISEYILVLSGVNLDCNFIIGEGISLIVLQYALLTLNKAKAGF